MSNGIELREAIRARFEFAIRKIAEGGQLAKYSLSPLTINGQFHHYMDRATDDAWIGFQLAEVMHGRKERQFPAGWKQISEGNPAHGLYLAIYRQQENLPVALLEFGTYEFIDQENEDRDDDGYTRGIGWHESQEVDGEHFVYLRDVVAYMPVNYGAKGLEQVRAKIKEQAEVPA